MATLYTVASIPMSSLVVSQPLTPLSGPESDLTGADYNLSDIVSAGYLGDLIHSVIPKGNNEGSELDEYMLAGIDPSSMHTGDNHNFGASLKSKLSLVVSGTDEIRECGSPTVITTASSATSLPSPPASAPASGHVSPELSRQVSAADLSNPIAAEWVVGSSDTIPHLQLPDTDAFHVHTPLTAPSSPSLLPTQFDLSSECPELDIDDYLVSMGATTSTMLGESMKVSPSSDVSFQSSTGFYHAGASNSTVFDMGLIGSMQLITDFGQAHPPSALITPPQSSGAQELDYFYQQHLFTTTAAAQQTSDAFAPIAYVQPFLPSIQQTLDSSLDSSHFLSMSQNTTLFMPTYTPQTSPQDLHLIHPPQPQIIAPMYQPQQFTHHPAPTGKLPILPATRSQPQPQHPQTSTRPTKPTAPPSFPCPFPECNKVFQQKFNLKSHMRSHATERAYQCNMCDAAFRRSHDLKRHHRSLHTQVKPFGCDLCDKRFSRMDALKRHTRRHMNGDVSD